MRKDGKKDYCSWSPDVVFGVDIGECCKKHDNTWHKEYSDKRFGDNIKKTFIDAGKPFLGSIVSSIYWFAVVVHRRIETFINI